MASAAAGTGFASRPLCSRLSRRAQLSIVVIIAVVNAGLVSACTSNPPSPIAEYPIPTADSGPLSITAGPDGNLWFTESNAGNIGRITPSGAIVEFPTPTASGRPGGITAGSDGNLWFTEPGAGAIGRITRSGTILQLSPPTGSNPTDIANGPDSALWITETNRIARLTPTGIYKEVSLGSYSGPEILADNITPGPDSNLWFTEDIHSGTSAACRVGHVTLSWTISEFSLSVGACPLGGLTSGPDGALWVTETGANRIARITTSGTITEFAVGSSPRGIATGPDGALWFTFDNNIGRITLSGAITTFTVPTEDSTPEGITKGPDGALWFTEENANQIGRIAPHANGGSASRAPKPTTYAPSMREFVLSAEDSAANKITVGPDGALWFTEAHKIGRITTAGTITEFPINGSPSDITSGPDGALWFTLCHMVGRITTSGMVSEYPLPTSSAFGFEGQTYCSVDITAGPDGALWFTEDIGSIGRITPAGAITEFSIAESDAEFDSITKGPDNALWFTESFPGGAIRRLTPNGALTTFTLPVSGMNAATISGGSDGALWFTEDNSFGLANLIGRITREGKLSQYPLPIAEGNTITFTTITAGLDGNLWFIQSFSPRDIGMITPQGKVTLFPVPPEIQPADLVFSPDDYLWITDQDRIVRITPGVQFASAS